MIASRLPSFIAPHLARLAQPFDSDDWLFEPKRDGTRVLAFIDQGSVRLVNRNRVDVTERYPETVEALAKLKPGCIMDGELVVFRNGKPDFERLMARNRTTNPAKAKRAAVATPATLVAFDLLYEHFDAVMGLDLQTRRQKLQKLITRLPENRVAFSDGIIGSGFALFQAACEQEYRPGQRTWLKIKRRQRVECVIIGYTPGKKVGFESLLVAVERDGELQACGSVEFGFNREERACLSEVLQQKKRAELRCEVSFLEWTSRGHLRTAVFERLL